MGDATLARRPGSDDAARLVERALQVPVTDVARFPTGLDHFVYDVQLADGRRVVARLSARGPDPLLGAVEWSRKLRRLGVPLPAILSADLAAEHTPFAAMLLERLPGTDLGHVIDDLSPDALRSIATSVVDAQRRTATLQRGVGFGYVASADGPFPHTSWTAVVAASLARSRKRIEKAGVFDAERVTELERQLTAHRAYLDGVQPVPFLDDTTTKNVLVHEGRLSGIVDVDVVCYGDPLWTLALTRMALLSGEHELTYTAIWQDLLGLTDEQRSILPFYTAVFCVDFMGEMGQLFNQAEPLIADPERVELLNRLYASLSGQP